MTVKPNYHRVTVTLAEPDEDGWRDDPVVTFTCTAPEDAECRVYPECDCEWFTINKGHDEAGHPVVAGRECWVCGWFDFGAAWYTGSDSDDDCLPTVERSGSILVSLDEDHVEWTWSAETLMAELSAES